MSKITVITATLATLLVSTVGAQAAPCAPNTAAEGVAEPIAGSIPSPNAWPRSPGPAVSAHETNSRIRARAPPTGLLSARQSAARHTGLPIATRGFASLRAGDACRRPRAQPSLSFTSVRTITAGRGFRVPLALLVLVLDDLAVPAPSAPRRRPLRPPARPHEWGRARRTRRRLCKPSRRRVERFGTSRETSIHLRVEWCSETDRTATP